MRVPLIGLGVAAVVATSSVALAQTPSIPLPPGNISVVVTFPPGGPLDVVARLLADKFGTKHGRSVVVENRAGAAGNVGTGSVARAEPNGLTWLATLDSVWSVNPHLGAVPGFSLEKDIAPVGQMGQVILMLSVNEKVPAKSWRELLALSRTKPLNFGSAGIGAPGHLAFEYLKVIAPELDAVHVPFRGNAQASTELLAGNVEAAFIAPGSMLEHVRAGKIRGLAISDTKRFAALPEVPSAPEAGLGDFVAKFTNVLAVPGKTPDAIRTFLAGEIDWFMGLPDVRARLDTIGTEALATGEAQTRAWLAQESERWSRVVKARGLKAAPPEKK